MARQQTPSDAREQRQAMHPDRRLGLGLLALGTGYLAAAFLISEPEGGYAAVGPRVFPIGIGIALVAGSLWIAFRASGPGDTSALADRPAPADWRAVAPSAFVFLAYILLLEPIGYLPSTTAFIAFEARLLGSRRWGRDLVASLVVTVSVYALFSLLLGLRLPAGLLAGR